MDHIFFEQLKRTFSTTETRAESRTQCPGSPAQRTRGLGWADCQGTGSRAEGKQNTTKPSKRSLVPAAVRQDSQLQEDRKVFSPYVLSALGSTVQMHSTVSRNILWTRRMVNLDAGLTRRTASIIRQEPHGKFERIIFQGFRLQKLNYVDGGRRKTTHVLWLALRVRLGSDAYNTSTIQFNPRRCTPRYVRCDRCHLHWHSSTVALHRTSSIPCKNGFSCAKPEAPSKTTVARSITLRGFAGRSPKLRAKRNRRSARR